MKGVRGLDTVHDPELECLDLERVLRRPLKSQQLLPAHHPGQASYIWRIETSVSFQIVRTNRFLTPPDEDFWQGSLHLFGALTTDLTRLAAINRWLQPRVPWTVPQVHALVPFHGRIFAVLDWVSGDLVPSFDHLTPEALRVFGAALARLHQCHFPVFGPLALQDDLSRGIPAAQFSERFRSTQQFLQERFYPDEPLAQADHDFVFEGPMAPMMLDMDPSQFLTSNSSIRALVDTELYVIGPPQLELVGLEYLLSAESARAFAEGYATIAPLPPLRPVRHAFRRLLRALSFQGPVPWETWMAWPTRFPT